ncbi:MAG: hypothetical protein II726_02190 [Elusimicrobiaceae bacterium]|nr:hypothetical protein [Elusimicrobiaceae bacterium]
MKTQKIVLALALVAVTPAVLSAQDFVGGPGSKMSYIADNALARIRQNHKESNPQDQNPVKNQQTVEPQQTVQQAKTADTTPAYYLYGGPQGHAYLAGELASEKIQKRQSNKRKNTSNNTDTTTHKATQTRTTSTYNPYVGPEGHRAALGNAVKDARDTTPAVPNHVRDIDTVARNHQATLNNKTADKSAKQTNKTFRYYLNEIGQALAQEAPFMK